MTGIREHIAGCLNVIGGNRYPTWTSSGSSGHYRGGIYLIRHDHRSYTLREVEGRHNGTDDPRDAVRAVALSPFSGDDTVYFGGHDSAGQMSTDLAWMYSASLGDVLEVCAD